MAKKLIIAGAGGHALEVFDLVFSTREVYFYDDINLQTNLLRERPIFHSIEEIQCVFKSGFEFCIGVGGPRARETLFNKLTNIYGQHVSIKGKSFLSPFIKPNIFDVMNYCFLGPDTQIGKGTLINTGAQVHHQSQIGEFCEIGPKSSLLGNVNIKSFTSIGAGTTILPGINIGSNVIIGAGSVVTKSIPDDVIAYGNPAKIKTA